MKIKGLFWRGDAIAAAPITPPPPAPVSAGDPQVDQILAAFESMRPAMPSAQLAIAIAATVRAIGADRKQLAETLAKRLLAIDAGVADEHRRSSERRATRAGELEAATAKARRDIETMKQRIASLEQQLAAATTQVQQQNTGDQSTAAAFEQRARAEAVRLAALHDFLASAH